MQRLSISILVHLFFPILQLYFICLSLNMSKLAMSSCELPCLVSSARSCHNASQTFTASDPLFPDSILLMVKFLIIPDGETSV